MAFDITKLDEIQIENLSVSAIDDVRIDLPLSNTDVLSYEASSGKWVNKQVDKVTELDVDLDELHNVSVSGATLNDLIKFNGSEWVNTKDIEIDTMVSNSITATDINNTNLVSDSITAINDIKTINGRFIGLIDGQSASTSDTTIQIRNDISTNWNLSNPTLSAGVIGLETDTDLFKFGDGVTPWNSLPHHRQFISSGVYHHDPVIVEHNVTIPPYNSTIDIDSLKVVLFNNSTYSGIPLPYETEAVSGLALTNNSINYLAARWVSGGGPHGSAEIFVTTFIDDINSSSVCPIDTMLVSDGYIHKAHWDREAEGLPNKLNRRIIKTQRYAWESGLDLQCPAPYTNTKLTHGVVWRGVRAFELEEMNSSNPVSAEQWFLYHHLAGGAWTHSITNPCSGFNYTQYDSPTLGLQSLPNNSFNINWLFRGVEDHNHTYRVLSDTSYKDLPTAIAITKLPTLPSDITAHAVLVGRIICKQGVAQPQLIESAFGSTFQGSVINEHNELSGLQGGRLIDNPVSAEYYHLTLPEHTNLTSGNPTFNSIQFDTSPIVPTHQTGLLHWDEDSHTLELGLEKGVTMQIGQEQLIKAFAGSAIPEGKVVYVSGAAGKKPTVALASSNDEFSSSKVIGVTTSPISGMGTNDFGFVLTQGLLHDINTTSTPSINGIGITGAVSAGQQVWLDEVAGNLTVIKPVTPKHSVYIGVILEHHDTSGIILVSPVNGFELDELHDVLIDAPTSGQFLTYSSSGVWTNSPLSAISEFNEASSGKMPYHGFLNRTSSSLTFNNATRTFTLSGSNYDIYFNGVKKKFLTSSSIAISASPEWSATNIPTNLGQWFIWIYPTGALGCSKIPWDILETSVTPVATLYIQHNGSDYVGLVAEERHGFRRSLAWHNHAHYNYGTSYTRGFTTLPTFTSGNTFNFTGGLLSDEDIENSVYDGSIANTCEIAYRKNTVGTPSASAMYFYPVSGTYVLTNPVNGRAYYDLNGTLTDLSTGSQFGIYWIYGTNKLSSPVVSIMGQGVYGSIGEAQSAPYPTLVGLSVAEWRLLYRVIIQGANNAFIYRQADSLYNQSVGPVILGSTPAPVTVAASNVSYISTGSVSSSNVQSAITELDVEKLSIASASGTYVSKLFTINGSACSGDSLTITEGTTYTDSMAVTAVAASGGYQKKSTVQNLGTKTSNYTVDFNSGRFTTVTASAGASTITIPNWSASAESVDAWLYITQGATAVQQTLNVSGGTAGANNIIASGAYTKTLPYSGANLTDSYCFTWTGTNWMITNMLFDVKAIT